MIALIAMLVKLNAQIMQFMQADPLMNYMAKNILLYMILIPTSLMINAQSALATMMNHNALQLAQAKQ